MQWVRDYVRSRVRPDVHFLLTEYELRLLMLKLMDNEGLLDETSSRVIRTPVFGKAYVAEKGNIGRVVDRLFVDALPGATLIRFV